MSNEDLAAWVERSIKFMDFGDALPGELSPDPLNYCVAERMKIVRDHTKNVALLDDGVRYLEQIEEKNPREIVLLGLLNRRTLEACQILMSLLGEAN